MDHPQLTANEFASKSFDFLIIGGGTAGLAVAARLSEHRHFTVGVLEAGPVAIGDSAVDCPGLAGRALGTEVDWSFSTTPQPGLGGRTVPYARGKILGGSSALNYMTWNRAARQDYDDWRDLGNSGWGWDDLLPYFKKSETFHKPSEATQRATRVASHDGLVGHDGPVQVSYPNEFTASHRLWHRTLNAVGVESNDNHLAGSNTGCWTSVVSVDPRDAARSYAANAYYAPNSSRSNLVVLSGAEVLEIVLTKDGDSWIARGVRFIHGGAEFSAFASREVILSAGSVQSPQILELSGIGGSAVLSAAGVPVKVDNPNVGENLQDHLTTTTVFEVDPSLPNPDDLRHDSVLAAAEEEYARTRTGPLTILPVSIAYVPASRFIAKEALGPLLSSFSVTTDPDNTAAVERDTLLRRRFQSNNLGHVEYIFELGNWGIDFPAESGKKYGSMLQILQYPLSKGSVHIQPPGPNGTRNLAISPQYLAGVRGSLDLEILLHAHRFGQKICATEPLASIIRAQVWPPPDTGSGDNKSDEDEDLRGWLRRVLTTDWHPVGTCAMGGRAGASGGVVNERLRVYGVQRLRVVDASVMPLQISAHLQATVYAIAEKGATMILEDHS